LHEQAINLEPRFLGQCRQGGYDRIRFHISKYMEISAAVKMEISYRRVGRSNVCATG